MVGLRIKTMNGRWNTKHEHWVLHIKINICGVGIRIVHIYAHTYHTILMWILLILVLIDLDGIYIFFFIFMYSFLLFRFCDCSIEVRNNLWKKKKTYELGRQMHDRLQMLTTPIYYNISIAYHLIDQMHFASIAKKNKFTYRKTNCCYQRLKLVICRKKQNSKEHTYRKTQL